MAGKVEGKVAFVTGAASGIGRAAADGLRAPRLMQPPSPM